MSRTAAKLPQAGECSIVPGDGQFANGSLPAIGSPVNQPRTWYLRASGSHLVAAYGINCTLYGAVNLKFFCVQVSCQGGTSVIPRFTTYVKNRASYLIAAQSDGF